ncbi:MAG: hypothetical protein LAN84_00355 [Acidobacteriia bacterium]|nr:hypothetical protein [Terriglobia bacterium]
MSKFRFVPVQPDRAAQWESLRSAFALHELLTDLQCDSSGRVNYGRPFSYTWLLARWPGNPDDRPCLRTLKYHMAKLKRAGLVDVRVIGFGGGMTVRLLGSAKWQNEAPAPAAQLPLLAPPVATIRREGKAVDNPVEKQWISTVSQIHMGQTLAPVGGKSLPRKEVKNLPEETIRAVTAVHSLPRVEKTGEELDARRRLLMDQAEMLQQKLRSSC